MSNGERWIGTEEAARRLGMSPDWVRRQIVAGRLRATIWTVGKRATYRIRLSDLAAFRGQYSR
jgi:excisionase family DNA binding protein